MTLSKSFLFFLLTIFIIFLSLNSVFATEKIKVGKFKEVNGKIKIQRDTTTINAKVNQPIFIEDIVKSDSISNAKIKLNDGSIFELKEKSNLVIKEVLLPNKIIKNGKMDESYKHIIDKVKKMKIKRNKIDYSIVPTLGAKGKDESIRRIDSKKVTIIYKWEE